MKRSLIFLYGMPGVGKLTVAKELSKLTGFAIYHNHLTSDLVYSVFPRGECGSKLKQEIRNLVIERWAKDEENSVVTTLIYKKGDNEDYFEQMSNTAKEFGIEVFYFHLTCSMELLKKRVVSPDRKRFNKIVNWKDAQEKMEKCNMSEEVPYLNNFRIDTTELSPEETARKILEILNSSN